MGLGMALLEQTQTSIRSAGRMMNANLAEYYLIPVNADIGLRSRPQTIASPRTMPSSNPLGTKPVGEIGICGAAAAIANAVFHATGRRKTCRSRRAN